MFRIPKTLAPSTPVYRSISSYTEKSLNCALLQFLAPRSINRNPDSTPVARVLSTLSTIIVIVFD